MALSKWIHSICVECWNARNSGHEPVRLKAIYRTADSCCFCGHQHKSGIFIRQAPDKLMCKGIHGEPNAKA